MSVFTTLLCNGTVFAQHAVVCLSSGKGLRTVKALERERERERMSDCHSGVITILAGSNLNVDFFFAVDKGHCLIPVNLFFIHLILSFSSLSLPLTSSLSFYLIPALELFCPSLSLSLSRSQTEHKMSVEECCRKHNTDIVQVSVYEQTGQQYHYLTTRCHHVSSQLCSLI